MQKPNRKKIRRTVLILGGFAALGAGAYFGTRKSIDQLTAAVHTISDGMSELVAATQGKEYRRLHDMDVIDDAVRNARTFVYYPGLGVRLDQINQKAKKAA